MEEILRLEGPRLSFSQDDHMLEIATMAEKLESNHLAMEKEGEEKARIAEKTENAQRGENDDDDDDGTEFSFEFSSSLSLDLPREDKMLSAEELFFNGKLRPLSKGLGALGQEMHDFQPDGKVHFPDLVVENISDAVPRRNSDVKREASCLRRMDAEFRANLPLVRTSLDESLAMAKQHLRSLHESPRCLSMTIEGSRGHPRRSCVSLNSSRCSSPTRLRTSGTFSQPPTTPTSPKAVSATQKSSKFLHFFKLKKHINGNKEALLLSSENPTMSSGSRLARTFWPFSRSNSAGESKRSHGVSPLLPKRSNSAGESKTTSATLLPNTTIINKHNVEAVGSDNTIESLIASCNKQQLIQSFTQQADKKGLPPLPLSNTKKTGSGFMLPNGGGESKPLSHTGDGAGSSLAPTSYMPPSMSHTFEEVRQVLSAQREEADASTTTNSGTLKANPASPGRHTRHVSASNPTRNIMRGSPFRPWSNPSMGASTRSMQRLGPLPRGLNVRPKDAFSRDTPIVRVTPVLNVPACMTPSSKSKLFNLSNLFSKREKIARGYTMLVVADSQSGG
ncbi:hypothetical protein GOP47_0028867 [Adiantum capillus-veneris]|nr:hypothetical protein GOP47_0028867 [Adiantum capillus-veneris]